MKNLRRVILVVAVIQLLTLYAFSQKAEDLYQQGIKEEDYWKKMELFTNAITLDTKHALAYYERGALRLTLLFGDSLHYVKALQDFNTSIVLDGFHYKSYLGRADCKRKLGDYYGAIQDYTKSLISSDDRQSKSIITKRAECKMEMEDFRGAIFDFNKAIELFKNELNDSKNTQDSIATKNSILYFYYRRGVCYYAIDKFQEAIKDFTIVIDDGATLFINYVFKDVYFTRAMCYINLNYIDEGCLDLSKAGELGFYFAYDEIKKHCNK
jgi:tetratricopeptide (TPR) repeat protein